MNKFKKICKNVMLFIKVNSMNAKFYMSIIMILCSVFMIYSFFKPRENNQLHFDNGSVVNQSNPYRFPDKTVIDAYANPMLFDAYRGTFGAHFDTLLLRRSDYKLLILNEDSSQYFFDSYTQCDDLYSGTLGGTMNLINTTQGEQNALTAYRKEMQADYMEEYDGKHFYFFVLEIGKDFNSQLSMTSFKDIPLEPYAGEPFQSDVALYFEYFGWPAQWARLVCPQELWLLEEGHDFNDPFWEREGLNLDQTIVIPYLDGMTPNGKSFDFDDLSTYTDVTVLGVDKFYCRGDVYNSLDDLESFLKYNNFMTLQDGKKFTEELFSEYNIDLLN